MNKSYYTATDVARHIPTTHKTAQRYLALRGPVGRWKRQPREWHRLDQTQFQAAIDELKRLKAERPAQPLRGLRPIH